MPSEVGPQISEALAVVFEAARQAGEGAFVPDDALGKALASLVTYMPDIRPSCVQFWRTCTRLRFGEINAVTGNHLRGLEAMALWRTIAAGVGLEFDETEMKRIYATTRTPAPRGIERKTTPLWLT